MNKPCAIFFLVAFLVPVSPTHAQKPPPARRQPPHIGYLGGDAKSPSHEAFRQGLKDLGYLEGQNILIEWRYAEDESDRFTEFAKVIGLTIPPNVLARADRVIR